MNPMTILNEERLILQSKLQRLERDHQMACKARDVAIAERSALLDENIKLENALVEIEDVVGVFCFECSIKASARCSACALHKIATSRGLWG